MKVACAAVLLLCSVSTPVWADGWAPQIGGEARGFFVGLFPYQSPLLPANPTALGAFDFRLKVSGHVGAHVKYVFQPLLQASLASDALGDLPGAQFTATSTEPQAVDLRWDAIQSDRYSAALGIDRLYVAAELPHLTLTFGRQPVTFGTTFFFTPEDLVAPFSPTTIDREYKPSVDALRADVYIGASGQISAVVAYGGAWDLPGMVGLVRGGETFGVWDVGLFGGAVHGDGVVGADTAGSLGAVAIRGEATLTFPYESGSPFVRAVVGAERDFDRWSIGGELYWQTLGAAQPSNDLAFASNPRVLRGEIWELGRYYAAADASFAVSPIVKLAAFAVSNLADPSCLIGASVDWSVAENAELDAGLYQGLGARPDGLLAQSEFGLYPAAVFAEMKSYF